MSFRNLGFSWLQLCITIASIIAGSANSSLAQITPDETLPNNSQVRLEDNTRVIEGGTEAGDNLFHSFSEFSVPTGSEAWFNNSTEIQNIFSRVTGGAISNLDGLIKANGAANLFLLNPNGIIFGENASLDVGGSFVGTSAESLKFADGSEFSAVNPQSSPLLTVEVPIGLQYGSSPGSITVGDNTATNPIPSEPTLLEVPPGETLALVGSKINLNSSRLRALGGRIELGGLAAAGTVGINNDGSLTFPEGVERADVSISRGEVDVAAGGGGSISINAKNLEVTQGSELLAGIGSGLGTAESVAGELIINATDTVLLDNSFVYNRVDSGGVGKAGNLSITTGTLEVLNGAFLSASTAGKGNAGSVTIYADDWVKFDGEGDDGFLTGAASQVNPNAVGNAGGVSITTGSLEVLNGAFLSASTLGRGDAGSVTIYADDWVKFDNSEAFSQVDPNAVGDAGGVSITTGSLEVLNGAFLSASTFGRGKGGNLIIDADTLQLKDGGTITAQSTRTGIAGNIIINVKDNLNADNGQIITQAEESRGGNITITAGENIFLRNNSDIRTTLSTTAGSGGNITLNANAIVALEDSDILAFAPEGNGGNITFNTNAFLSDPLFSPTAETNDPLTESQLNKLDGNNRVDVNASGSISAGTISGIPDISQLQNSLTELTTNSIDTEALVASSCVAPSRERKGTFYIAGQAGLPYRPGEAVPSVYSAVGVQPIPQKNPETPRTPRWKKGDPIIEPTGVYLLEDGQRILSWECGT